MSGVGTPGPGEFVDATANMPLGSRFISAFLSAGFLDSSFDVAGPHAGTAGDRRVRQDKAFARGAGARCGCPESWDSCWR